MRSTKHKFFKITNYQECHHGFQYRAGLNTLKEPFNHDPKYLCGPGGFYFTTIDNIHKYYTLGIHLREVHLPKKDPEFKIVVDQSSRKWRANKIILGKKYPLWDPLVYQKFNLPIPQHHNELFYEAVRRNKVNFLDMCLKHDPSFCDHKIRNTQILDLASENGHVDILEWWKKSRLPLKYHNRAIDRASIKKHFHVLEWWKNSGLKLKYSEDAIDHASVRGHLDVLNWWKNSGLELKYSENASTHRHLPVDVLNWWKNSGLKTPA